MPGFDGTGPQGRGPITGRGMGFCVLKVPNDNPGQVEGFVGIQGMPVDQNSCESPYAAARAMYGSSVGRGLRGGRRFLGCGWADWFCSTGLPGWGRGAYQVGFAVAPTANQEKQALKQQAQYLSDSLDVLNKRIEELEEDAD